MKDSKYVSTFKRARFESCRKFASNVMWAGILTILGMTTGHVVYLSSTHEPHKIVYKCVPDMTGHGCDEQEAK